MFGLIHDYGYRTQFIKSRVFWDSLALVILPQTTSRLFAYITYIGLRLFGWYAWMSNKWKGLYKFPEAKKIRDQVICGAMV